MDAERLRYESLCREIWQHNKRYYIDHLPAISDYEWDVLFHSLEEIEKNHPEWASSASPTQRVGEALTEGFKSVVHHIPMLSLPNTYSKDELEDFIKRVHRLMGRTDIVFSVELKMDGIAVSLQYKKGLLACASTRGDGKQGDDITANIKTIASLPLQLQIESSSEPIPDHLELRGEVYMPRKGFIALNEQREAFGDDPWANPRNAAAGSLKLLDPKEVAKRKLAIVLYAIADDSSGAIKDQVAAHAYMRALGLPTLHETAICHTLEEIWAFAEKVRQLRPSLPFDIDGIVIKVADFHAQKQLGAAGKNPRWAAAYKFTPDQETTRILNITVQVGRTGVLTPVAELEPVLLAGSTIARATLHNEEEIERKDIRIGDAVVIEKGGDVIPKVVRVNLEMRPVHSIHWKMPHICPSCSTPVVRVEEEVAVRCPNSKGCPEQQIRRIAFFVGKEAMDIENLGERVVTQLVQKGFVKAPSDIYKLTADNLSQLEGFKQKSVENLLKGIERSRDISFPRLIMALGIKHVGIGTADLLAAKAKDIHALMKISAGELIEIEGIGEKVAEAIVSHFADPQNCQEVEALLAAGIRPQEVKPSAFTDHPFQSKTFVLTGSLQKYTRLEATNLIKERGGKVTAAVSQKTHFVLAGDDAGSKLDKARKWNIAILTEADFQQQL